MAKQKRASPSSPFDYKDRTERPGPTEAHITLGGDKRSFMFEQVLPERARVSRSGGMLLAGFSLIFEEGGLAIQSASGARAQRVLHPVL
jgi:hypothetical protein